MKQPDLYPEQEHTQDKISGIQTITPIAHIRTDFSTKFGIPRQSNVVEDLEATIVFEEAYRDPNALRGLEDYSYIWLIWQFSESVRDAWSPTVRPPHFKGNKRMGVFATRAPFRPNPLGLSSVRLEKIVIDPDLGPVIHVRGADLMNGTPIYDIKPYIPTDCHPDSDSGFSHPHGAYTLEVHFPPEHLTRIPDDKQEALIQVLAHDPRPSYHEDPERIYGVEFAGFDVRFRVDGLHLTVCEIVSL